MNARKSDGAGAPRDKYAEVRAAIRARFETDLDVQRVKTIARRYFQLYDGEKLRAFHYSLQRNLEIVMTSTSDRRLGAILLDEQRIAKGARELADDIRTSGLSSWEDEAQTIDEFAQALEECTEHGRLQTKRGKRHKPAFAFAKAAAGFYEHWRGKVLPETEPRKTKDGKWKPGEAGNFASFAQDFASLVTPKLIPLLTAGLLRKAVVAHHADQSGRNACP